MIIETVGFIVMGLVIITYLAARYYPAFGGRASKERRELFTRSVNFSNGKFINQLPTSMAMGPRTMLGVMLEMVKGRPNGKPKTSLAVEKLNPTHLMKNTKAQITWFGHSALLLQVNGLNLLLDPMFGKAPSPFPIIGGKRYSKQLPIDLDKLPGIDAVVLSHDHYDHLDYGSIMKLKHKVKVFFVPLGVGAHLERWGISRANIKELDWWDQVEFAGLALTAAPARHFSGRSVKDRFATLWCSWIIDARHTRIFFSGDSGYGPHFAEIGGKYGPFDLTLMECGQYDERWQSIHMMPEETVQAHLDVKGKLMIPIHWGAFTLSLHSWTDPVERVVLAAKRLNAAIATPKIGETVTIGAAEYPTAAWWKQDHPS